MAKNNLLKYIIKLKPMLNRIFLVAIWATLLFSCTKEKNECVCIPLPDAPDKYNYPIKPGTPEWNNIHTTDSLFLAVQIPVSVLNNISTDGLVQSCIENPLCLFQFAFSSRIQGRDVLFVRLNCYQELIKRTNGAERLIARYKLMNPCCVKEMTPTEQGAYSMLFFYTEILLTKDSVINQLTTSQKKEVVKIVIEKDNLKKNYLDSSGVSIISRTPAILILSTIMETEFYQPYINEITQSPNLKSFTQTGILPTSDIYDIVLMHAKKYIQ